MNQSEEIPPAPGRGFQGSGEELLAACKTLGKSNLEPSFACLLQPIAFYQR